MSIPSASTKRNTPSTGVFVERSTQQFISRPPRRARLSQVCHSTMHKPETSLKVRFAVSATAGEFAVKVFELAMNWQSWPYSEIHKFWLRLFTQMTQRQAYCLQPHRSDVFFALPGQTERLHGGPLASLGPVL